MIIHPFIPSQQIHPPKSSVDPRGPSFQHPTVFLAPLFAEGWAVRTFEVRKAMGKAENAQKMARRRRVRSRLRMLKNPIALISAFFIQNLCLKISTISSKMNVLYPVLNQRIPRGGYFGKEISIEIHKVKREMRGRHRHG